MDRLKVSRELASRYLNDGFSGGEKKRVEILQMAMLKPRIAVLDETDSGLDIDALRIVAGGVKELVGPEMGALVITHYQRILNYIKPDFVHVFVDGRIVDEGGPELAHKLEAEGYEAFEPEQSERRPNGSRPRPKSSRRSAATTSTASRPDEARTTSSSRAAASRTRSSRRSPRTRTSPTGCASSGTSRSTTSSRARCRSGAGTSTRSTSRTSSTTSSRPRSRPSRGRTCPPTSRTPGTSSGSPRPRRSTSPASAPSTSRRSSTTSSRST